MEAYFNSKSFSVFDTSLHALGRDKLSPFALDDALIRQVGSGRLAGAVHFWPIEDLIILGQLDTRLPYLEAGLEYLQEEEQLDVLVRNAGGLAVAADAGVLNFTLVLQETPEQKISIDTGYQIMMQLVKKAFSRSPREIEAFEIADSYCPGDYDLSIGGKKFAGIAQRRFKSGAAIMIYMSIEGPQQKRGETIRRFYDLSRRNEPVRHRYPSVDPASMANLSDLLGIPLTVPEAKAAVLTALRQEGARITEGIYTDVLMKDFQDAHTKMLKRNERIFQPLQD